MDTDIRKVTRNIDSMNTLVWMEGPSIIMPEVVMGSDLEKKDSMSNFSSMATSSKFGQPVELMYSSMKSHELAKSAFEHSLTESMKKDDEVVTCTWCKTQFLDKNMLLDHIKQNHHVDKVHRCVECAKVFTQKSNLKAHYRLHTGEKPFKCSYCPKMFAQKSNLMNHLSVHVRDKPFGCPICKRAFSQRSNLKSHIFTHTGERPYKCHLCAKEFVQKSNLVSHVRTHTSEKPHHCDICDKCFSQRSNLISHLKLHAKASS